MPPTDIEANNNKPKAPTQKPDTNKGGNHTRNGEVAAPTTTGARAPQGQCTCKGTDNTKHAMLSTPTAARVGVTVES